MCIISGPVRAVTATRIFVSRHGAQQFTAYQMNIELGTGEPRAMILPVPFKDGDPDIELVDMSETPDFFEKLDGPWKRRSRSLSKSLDFGADSLEVQEVGDYRVSVAPTLADVVRARTAVFQLSPTVTELLAANYGQGYAFVIAILRKSGDFSPLGYISTVGAGTSAMFVPTRHEHGHGQGLPEWDHLIYSTGVTEPLRGRLETARGARFQVEAYTNAWRGDWLNPIRQAVPAIRPFLPEGTGATRISAEGKLENLDLVLRVA